MEQKRMQALAGELAKGIKTEKDLGDLSGQLMKLVVETALGAEMESHLGYAKHEVTGRRSGNSRNGSSTKTLKSQHGHLEVTTPRDRNGTFEPQLLRKRQTRLTEFDDQILALYAKGMSTRDITAAFREMYGAEVCATLISRVTDAVIDEVEQWQNRVLDDVYPIVFLDCVVLKIRQDSRVIKKSMYVALGINCDGEKELLGLWLSENEGAKFWLSVLTEIRNRGVREIFIACVDGLTGFPDAIEATFPHARVQLCMVHMVRNSVRYVSWKDRKAVCAGLKAIYTSATEAQAEKALSAFETAWDDKYSAIGQSWRRHWPNLITLFDYPEEIRRVTYTTNAIESLNSVIRKATKNRRIFPSDASAMKVVFLATQAASARWNRPIRNWKAAMNRFHIEHGERLLASQ
jgi:Transposase and inactivated derivatives